MCDDGTCPLRALTQPKFEDDDVMCCFRTKCTSFHDFGASIKYSMSLTSKNNAKKIECF